MMKYFRSILLFLVPCLLFFTVSDVFAAKTIINALPNVAEVAKPAGVETTDVESVTATLIKTALSVVGLLFFGLMVYGGMLWLNSRGDEAMIEKAKGTIKAAVIGLAISVMAYAITVLVSTRLLGLGKQAGGEAGCAEKPGTPCRQITDRSECIATPPNSELCAWQSGRCVSNAYCHLRQDEKNCTEADVCVWND